MQAVGGESQAKACPGGRCSKEHPRHCRAVLRAWWRPGLGMGLHVAERYHSHNSANRRDSSWQGDMRAAEDATHRRMWSTSGDTIQTEIRHDSCGGLCNIADMHPVTEGWARAQRHKPCPASEACSPSSKHSPAGDSIQTHTSSRTALVPAVVVVV